MKIKAIVDRIEGQLAVIRFKNFRGEIILPLKALPKDAKQGTVINFSIEKDVKETDELKEEINSLLEELND